MSRRQTILAAQSHEERRPKVLVVEDETIVARDIQMQLLNLGYEPVGHATRGETAMGMAGELHPDLVLMDIRLAGAVDGIDAAQFIHSHYAIPVVFLSAFSEDDTLARAKLANPYGYILKPFSERELRTVLELALYRHQTERQQNALHEISEAANAALDMPDLCRRIHAIISDLLPASNFYVALHDAETDILSFPYYIDERDPPPAPSRLMDRRSLTRLVLESSEPLLLSSDALSTASPRLNVDIYGTLGLDWLGVPLKIGSVSIGMLAVQSYTGTDRYTEKDKHLLRFVSGHVAASIVRLRAQQALLESETRYRFAFDQSPIAIALIAFPDGSIHNANAACLNLFGFTETTIRNKSLLDLNIWVDLGDRQRLLMQLGNSGAVNDFETRLRRHDGSLFEVAYSGNLVTIDNARYSLGSLQDITARKKAERWQRHYADTLALITTDAATLAIMDTLIRFAESEANGLRCVVEKARGKDGQNAKSHPAHPTGFSLCGSQPIISSNRAVLGAFAAYCQQPRNLTADETELLRNSAALAAVAMERARAREDQRLAKAVFEQSKDAIMLTDKKHRIVLVNAAFEALAEHSSAEVIGQRPDVMAADRNEPGLQKTIQEAIHRNGYWQGEVWGKKKSGATYPQSMSITRITDERGAISHYISIFKDLTEQKLQLARIEELAFHDSLTGLPNRALLLDRLDRMLSAAQRRGGHGAVLFFDLDRFKEINDSQGHAVGDQVLIETARRFQAVSRDEETLARLGGDEFMFIAENADHRAASLIAMRLLSVLSTPIEVAGIAHSISASIGIACYPEDGQTSTELIKCSDIAMYRAKADGGGIFRHYQAQMSAALEKRLSIAKRLTHALRNGSLQLYYQPQVELGSGRIIGAEALLRWNDPELGWISPAEFIPIAEERGMMGPLGDWVLLEACRQINDWAQSGAFLDGKLAVNVSALQMDDLDIVDRLLAIVTAAGLTADRFEIELTESSMMANPERAVTVMERLRSAGFDLSIDDFGTGYSSLAYLKRFSANQIKIDISFVRNMLTDNNDRTMVTAIIAMARGLGLRTVAEGVEDPDQAAALLALGGDFAQGYYFGRPEPGDVFMRNWLSSAPETAQGR